MERPARDWLAANGLLFPLLALNRWFFRRVVRPSTRVVIEGFPRSANSYTFLAFRRSNPGVRVGHHLHTPLQVIWAARLRIPCAVLIRPPVDAVASVLVMDRGRISDTAAYRSYIHFYSRALRVRDKVVVAPFDEVTTNPARMVERINARFGTEFQADPMSDDDDAAIKARLDRGPAERGLPPTSYGAPSAEKDRRREALRKRVAANPLLGEAERLHAEWIREHS